MYEAGGRAGTTRADAWRDGRPTEFGHLDFIERYGPDVELDSGDGRAAFGTTLQLVDDWRRFPFIDPELPSSLLPEQWVGARAQQVLDDRRHQHHGAAVAWFRALESDADAA